MQVWDLASMSLVPPTVSRMECKVWMLALAWPHVFVVGGTDWKGFKVFNMVTGQLVRNVQVNCITSGGFITNDFSFRLMTLHSTTFITMGGSSSCLRSVTCSWGTPGRGR